MARRDVVHRAYPRSRTSHRAVAPWWLHPPERDAQPAVDADPGADIDADIDATPDPETPISVENHRAHRARSRAFGSRRSSSRDSRSVRGFARLAIAGRIPGGQARAICSTSRPAS